MEVTYSYKGLSKEEEGRVFEYFSSKTGAIEGLVGKYAEDAVLLAVVVERFEKHDAFQVDLRLTLPAAVLVAQEVSHGVEKAIDDSKDRLVAQLKKHQAQLRKDRNHRSIKETSADFSLKKALT